MKKLLMIAVVALAGVAMAECPEGPKCEGPRPGCERKCRGPKPVMLVLDKELSPEKVAAYKAEVAAAIDEIVGKHLELAAKVPEGAKCPEPRIMLVVDGGRMMGPKRPRGMQRGVKGPRPECGERPERGERPECGEECGPEADVPPPPPAE